MKTYYKGAMPSGYDFYTGNTINYRENIGKTVKVPERQYDAPPKLCSSSVIHASLKPNDIFIGSKLPCSVYKVQGNPVVRDNQKSGFKELYIIEEIPQATLDELFGWRYSEICNPIHPLKISAPEIINEQIDLLRSWASVWDSLWASLWASVGASVWDSVWASVWDSLWASVRASLWDSLWASVWDSVGASVWDSVRASVWDSVWASVWAYGGSMFPNITKWKHAEHKQGQYPFQATVDLWKMGLVASFDGKTWRLHGGEKAKILWEGKI